MIRTLAIALFTLVFAHGMWGQSTVHLLREGYELYQDGKFEESAEAFSKAMEKDPSTFKPWFNQGGAWYEADSLGKAMEAFEMALSRINDPKERAAVYHNIGNSLMKQEDYAKSIEAFKQALINDPYDEDTRYNLAYAMTKLQQQQDGDEGNQEQDDKQEQEQQDDEQQEQNQGEQEQKENEQQQESQQQKMDPQQAEQMLNALENEDRKTQEKVTREMMKVEPKKREKDW